MASSSSATPALNWGQSAVSVRSVQEISNEVFGDNNKRVPDRYIRPCQQRPCMAVPVVGADEIPVIDMAKLRHQNPHETQKLIQACEEWGFFQAVNHGIPGEIMECVKRAGNDFFHLSLEEKQKYSMRTSDFQGYGQNFVVSNEQKLDWADCLAIILSPQHCKHYDAWPRHPTHFRCVVDKYGDMAMGVAGEVVEMMERALGIKGGEMKEMFGEEMYVKMRMNYYPRCPRPDLVNGLSPHADMTGITVLMQDDHVVGLQVRKGEERWVAVKPIKGALVINVGNLVEVMSNGKFKSVEHRVITNSHSDRLSVGMFYGPSFDSVVSPVSSLVDGESKPALFKSFRYRDYVDDYFSRALEGKDSLYRYAAIPGVHPFFHASSL